MEIKLIPLNSYDWEFVYSLLNDIKVNEFGNLGFSFPESDLQIKKKVERWVNSNNQKHFLILHQSEKVGIAQIYNISGTNRKCELGILILSELFNKGIGTKTLKLLINMCFNKMNMHKIEVAIIQNNVGSIKIFEKLGFTKEGILKESIFKNGEYEDLYLYGLINKKPE